MNSTAPTTAPVVVNDHGMARHLGYALTGDTARLLCRNTDRHTSRVRLARHRVETDPGPLVPWCSYCNAPVAR